jgi:hypothetical protein
VPSVATVLLEAFMEALGREVVLLGEAPDVSSHSAGSTPLLIVPKRYVPSEALGCTIFLASMFTCT